MKDKLLLYTASIVSIVGLFMLFLIMFLYTPEEKKISEINDDMLGKKITVSGKISDIKNSKNSTVLIKIIQECTLDVTAFGNINNYNISNSSNIIITGRLQEYNGRKSLVADKIQLLP